MQAVKTEGNIPLTKRTFEAAKNGSTTGQPRTRQHEKIPALAGFGTSANLRRKVHGIEDHENRRANGEYIRPQAIAMLAAVGRTKISSCFACTSQCTHCALLQTAFPPAITTSDIVTESPAQSAKPAHGATHATRQLVDIFGAPQSKGLC